MSEPEFLYRKYSKGALNEAWNKVLTAGVQTRTDVRKIKQHLEKDSKLEERGKILIKLPIEEACVWNEMLRIGDIVGTLFSDDIEARIKENIQKQKQNRR